jgi:hypothetical protein
MLEKYRDDNKSDDGSIPFGPWLRKVATKAVFVDLDSSYQYMRLVPNLFISQCYSCKRFAVWKADQLLWPSLSSEVRPNPDLPDEVRADFIEASSILSVSPRGAAALLRLAVQKLLVHLGCRGKNINDDIGELVSLGLNPKVQQALDIIRVVGNNAVHPGHIDLRDDRATAESLLMMINLIADRMITEERQVQSAFDALPGNAKAAIAKRDKPSS